MKRKRQFPRLVLFGAFILLLGGCSMNPDTSDPVSSDSAQENEENLLTIGFAQVGEESDWRRANSASIEEAFSVENGYRLLFDDAQNDPARQIRAVRNFIQQEVDYIIMEPIIETGWEQVLGEAKEAGIPVIIADRMIELEDDSLYTYWIGSDNRLEGEKVCAYMHAWAEENDVPEEAFRIVNIQGTIGSTPQIGRDGALEDACKRYGWTLLEQTRGEFTQAKGREAMAQMLEAHPDLNVVYCDNDNEAYGAIEALEEAGKSIGTDIMNGEIMLVSFDAAAKGLSYVLDGQILCDGDCNPDHGPRVEEIVRELEKGNIPEKIQFVDEKIYASPDGGVEEITVDDITYPVTPVTQAVVDARPY